MKKLLFVLLMVCTTGLVATAQTHEVKNEVKVKKTATARQKVHNTFHRHHKHYSGVKVKHVEKIEKSK